MSQCKIILENYSGIYYAGSDIRGRIECYFDSSITVRAVKVRLSCKEHNEWTGVETYHDPAENKEKTRYITYTGDHTVISTDHFLFGTGHNTQEIGPGRHVYPFEITLPEHIPSSFNGPHGSICYYVKAIVDRPMRGDYEDRFIFVVKSPIDFNRMPKELQEVTSYEDEKTICCWCCAGGNVTVNIELPKTAFVPGENIDFKIMVSNLSNTNVEKIKCKFTKQITYRVDTPRSESKSDTEKILEFTEHGVGAHGEHTYNLQLQIPNYIEVPNFRNCKLFAASYKLAFTTVFSNWSMDMDIDIWPEMGHIAYNSSSWETIPSETPVPTQPGFYPTAPGPAPYPPAPAPYPPAGFYPPGPPMPGVGDSKAVEAGWAPSAPTAPSAPGAELPPPTYSQAQQMNNLPYPPQ